jgi:hypothetical protein
VEAEGLMTHDIDDSHARDLKKIDAILADIRTRLGEPDPEPLDPEMKTTLDELEKTGSVQRPSDEDKRLAKLAQQYRDRLIEQAKELEQKYKDAATSEATKAYMRGVTSLTHGALRRITLAGLWTLVRFFWRGPGMAVGISGIYFLRCRCDARVPARSEGA